MLTLDCRQVRMNDDPMAVLGPAAIGADQLNAVVGAAVGRQVRVDEWAVTPIQVNAISTEAVLHLHGTARPWSNDRDGSVPWDLLVKVIRSPRHWPYLPALPETMRRSVIDSYPWRAEVDLRDAGLAGLMPPGLRLPALHRCDDLGDDRLALWTEWIDTAPAAWDLERYRRSAVALGRMATRCRGLVPGRSGPPGRQTQLRQIVTGPIAGFVVPRIADPGLRDRPMFAGLPVGPLFDDLIVLGGRLESFLDRFETLPRSIGHGDACPQNLLIPRDDPDTLVAIDLTWPHPEAIGFDLGQLLIGHAHSGDLAVDALPQVHDLIIEGFVEGLRVESCDVPVQDVTYAFEVALTVRSAFQSLPLERLDEPVTPELAEFAARRVELTRYLVDLGLSIHV